MKHGNEGQLVFLSLHSSILCTLTDPTSILLAEIRHCWGREASCSPERDAAQARVWLLHRCLALFARVPSPKTTKSEGPFRASHLKKINTNTWTFMKTFRFVFIWKKEFFYLRIIVLCKERKHHVRSVPASRTISGGMNKQLKVWSLSVVAILRDVVLLRIRLLHQWQRNWKPLWETRLLSDWLHGFWLETWGR